MNKKHSRDKIIVIPTQTARELFGYEETTKKGKVIKVGCDALLLYNFFYYTSNWQDTRNRPKAVKSFVKKGLGWGTNRYERAKKLLTEKGLVKSIVKRDKKGKVKGWFIELPFKHTEDTAKKISSRSPQMGVVDNHPEALGIQVVDAETTNAPSNIVSINAPSKYIQKAEKKETPQEIETIEITNSTGAVTTTAGDLLEKASVIYGHQTNTMDNRRNINKLLKEFTPEEILSVIQNAHDSYFENRKNKPDLSWAIEKTKNFQKFLGGPIKQKRRFL